MTPALLAVLGVLLAGPVPALLARWRGLRRTPRAAMLLWQGVALAAVLSALGAGLSLATDHGMGVVAGLALAVTAVVAARLLVSGHRVGTSLRAVRRHHREQLDLLATPPGPDRPGISVLETERPLAYCVPGVQASRVVVSSGALATLAPDELDAVLAHERAHLRARHDLVLEAFSVLHRAFPRWVSSAAALREVRTLVEVLADRAASRQHGAHPVARALVALAGASAPDAALGAGGVLVERIELLDGGRHRVQAAVVCAAAVAVVVVPTAFVAVPWLRGLV